MLVKICGITTVEDAQASVQAGADAIGLNFYPPSPRYVTPGQAALISVAIPKQVLTVGVFVSPTLAELTAVMQQVRLDVVQVHGTLPTLPNPLPWRLWQAARMDDQFTAAQLAGPAEAYLLDTPAQHLHGGTGQTFDWHRAQGLPKPIVLAGGLAADNVAEAIATARPWGVDACSRLESRPGYKDAYQVQQFIAAARAAEELL